MSAARPEKTRPLIATNILALSGSLGRRSSNTELLRAAQRLCAGAAQVVIYEGLRDIAPFDPDLEDDAAPEPVKNLRALISSADGVLISSPEYAHGVSGVLKNALDWTVSTGDFYDKAVAVLNASPRATIALEAMKENLRTMGARLVEEASITVAVMSRRLDADEIAADAEIAGAVRSAMTAFVRGIDALKLAKAAMESGN
ncbi:MAG TPA: NADPH-dependent FMN reductase [Candidatus Binataceae bacterium]